MGGRGQEALLRAPVRILGLPVTAAYLAAGGTPVETDELGGFFADQSVAEFNPDARSSRAESRDPPVIPSKVEGRLSTSLEVNGVGSRDVTNPRDGARDERGVIAKIPHAFSTDRAVAVGAHGVAFRAGGCAACFARTVEALEVGVPGVAIEALAALAWQRIVLGLGEGVGVVRLDGEAALVRRCEAHG